MSTLAVIGAVLAILINALSLGWVVWRGSGMIHTLKAVAENTDSEVTLLRVTSAEHTVAIARSSEAMQAVTRTMEAMERRLLLLEHPRAAR